MPVSTTRECELPQSNCPSCKTLGLAVAEVEYELGDFGSVLMSVTTCKSCGFRQSDIFSLKTHDPMATSLKVTSSKDLDVHVIRSGTATIAIPELGVLIEPGTSSEGFISNVEGVFARVENVLQFLRCSQGRREKQRADLVLKKMKRARTGRLRVTLVLRDPLGNSSIVSKKAKKRKLSVRELSRLKFGDIAVSARKRS